MAESKPEKDVKSPNIFERAKEEIDAILHTEKSPHHHDHHHKETHGLRDDIDESTPLDDVKAPSVFERAKEEIDALVQTIHPKKESHTNGTRDETGKAESKPDSLAAGDDAKTPNLIETVKRSPHHHHKETHGMSDDIDENTPINEVKGPNLFERAKEEIVALVQVIHPEKDSDHLPSSPKKEGGFRFHIGKGLEKVCHPWGSKRN